MSNLPPTLGSPVSSQSFIISANIIALWEMNSGLKLFTTAFSTIALEWNGNMGGYSGMEWKHGQLQWNGMETWAVTVEWNGNDN